MEDLASQRKNKRTLCASKSTTHNTCIIVGGQIIQQRDEAWHLTVIRWHLTVKKEGKHLKVEEQNKG